MEKMITIVTNMKISNERLEKIFSVPKTKELFEKLIKQESNKKKIKVLTSRIEKIFEDEDFGITPADMIQKDLKVFILADSIKCVVNGKSLNQAIQTEIQKQLEKAVVIEKVEDRIAEIEASIRTMEAFETFIKDMLS